jgi:hypothetical protein
MAYEVLIEEIYKYVSGISMVVNTDGYLDKWRLDYSEEKREHIWFDWKSSDKIDHYITIYDVNCSGLSRNSKLELASADAYEADYIKTEKSLGSYGILVKQYCGVIEQEINSLLMLSGSSDEHMMWGKLKERVRKKDIQLTGAWFDLYKMLDEIQKIRNLAMHGEEVSEKEFDILRKYRDRQLFEFISWTKLELEGIKHHPTVDEISEKFKE